MPGKKTRSKYKKKRARVFHGVRKQEQQHAAGNESSSTPLNSPKRVIRSLEKIKRNCPILKAKNKSVLTRNAAFQLGLTSLVIGHIGTSF